MENLIFCRVLENFDIFQSKLSSIFVHLNSLFGTKKVFRQIKILFFIQCILTDLIGLAEHLPEIIRFHHFVNRSCVIWCCGTVVLVLHLLISCVIWCCGTVVLVLHLLISYVIWCYGTVVLVLHLLISDETGNLKT